MKMTLIAFLVWLIVLVSLTFLFWLKPRSFFPVGLGQGGAERTSRETVAMVASLLAVLLFLSCFLFGIWIGIAEIRGVL